MRSLITIIILCSFAVSTNGQCDWDKSNGEDPFTGVIKKGTNWENIARSTSGSVSFKVVEFPQDSTIYLYVKVGLPQNIQSIRCFDGESKIMLKSGDNVITLNFLGEIDCGSLLTNYCELSSGIIETLRNSCIEMLRVVFAEGQRDFVILDTAKKRQNEYDINKGNYFIRTLKCFE